MQTLTVIRREVTQYFVSPFAYVIAAAFLVFTGILFSRYFQYGVDQAVPIDPAYIPSTVTFLLVFITPLLTMRLLAEEKREGTMELLLTSPVHEGSVVIGKFIGSWIYFSCILALTFIYQLILMTYAPPDIGHSLLAYIGVWLYAGAMIAIGLFFSALTDNQIVSAFLALITLLILYVGDTAGQVIGSVDLAWAIRQLSLQGHYSTSFGVGLLRAEDVAFYAGIIVIMLYVTIRLVESNRWR